MTILQAGYPKSGNFWLYRVVEGGLSRAGHPRSSFIASHPLHERAKGLKLSVEGQQDIDVLDIDPSGCHLRIGFHLRQRVEDLDEYLAISTHVWTHSPLLPRSLPVFQRFDPILYVIRDPRDVAVSMSRFAFTPYMLENDPSGEANPEAYLRHRLEEIVRDWVRHVAGYLRHGRQLGIHFMFYERLLTDFEREGTALLDRLGCRLTAAQFASLRSEVSFDEMQDRNRDHVRRGEAGGWRSVIGQDQARRVDEIAGDMLELLGYPLSHQARTDGLVLGAVPPSVEAIDRAEHQAERSPIEKTLYVIRFLAGPRHLRDKVAVVRRLVSKPGELLWKLK